MKSYLVKVESEYDFDGSFSSGTAEVFRVANAISYEDACAQVKTKIEDACGCKISDDLIWFDEKPFTPEEIK